MAAQPLPVLEPNLQISFYYRLQGVRRLHLQDALRDTVSGLDIQTIDGQLGTYVERAALQRAASFGLRGELFFPVPIVIRANPFLLGYYRLLLGVSQKEFYNKGPFGRFKCLEESGTITQRLEPRIDELCRCLIGSAEKLVVGLDVLSPQIVHELQLLTIGPQFRGSENTRIGQVASKEAYDLISSVADRYIIERTDKTMVLRNDSGRTVLIEFFADPDVRITEQLPSSVRPTLSIEIKGGTDASNIHNRIGEAEKSHQKAQRQGFREFWTIIRVDLDEAVARRESPTTSRFFHLDRITDVNTSEHGEFRDLLASMIGIQS